MWITKLQLTNIKSYGKDGVSIAFRPGVNLIQGKNGAGKSTILEAIGLALFDSKTYNHQQFVREGARSGTITVGFLSADDEREYEVVRGVGAGSTYVYDPEANRKLCEGKDETLAFLQKHLNIDAETDLAALFADAIGVPQGTMTAIFHETPRVRKEKFNRLLRIDSYERVWEALRETGRYIASLVEQNKLDQATLGGILNDLPSVNAAIESLEAQVAAARSDLQEIDAFLGEASGELEILDAKRSERDVLDRQIETLAADIRLHEERRARAEDDARVAHEAAVVVEETRAAFQIYETAQAELAALEADRQHRDGLLAQQNRVTTELKLCERELEQLAERLALVQQAEAEAARLEPLVEQQEQLERVLSEARQAQNDYEQTWRRIAEQRGMLADLEDRLARARTQAGAESISTADIAVSDELPEEASIDIWLGAARDTLTGLETGLERLAEARKNYDTAQAELDELARQLARRVELQAEIGAIEPDLHDAENRLHESQVELATLSRDREALKEYAALLADVDAVCPVCRRPMDDHARADADAHYSQEQERLNALSESVQERLDSLRHEADRLAEARDGLFEQMNALPAKSTGEQVQGRVDAAAAALESRLEDVVARLGVAGGHLAGIAEQLEMAELAAQELALRGEQADSISAELDALGDPRYLLERANGQVADRQQVEEARVEQQARLDVAQHDADTIAADLASYADLPERLSAARQQIATNEAAHRRYVVRIELAEQLETRQTALATTERELSAQTAALQQLQAQRAEVVADYDESVHEERRKAQHEYEIQRATVATHLKGHEETLAAHLAKRAELEKSRAELDRVVQEGERLSARREAFDFLRQSIRDAGPQITKQLVRMVAEQANRIFGDILGDHSLVLNWSEDYGISVNYRGEDRDFELLSGGEQMVAAIAIRLALLTHLTNVQFAFFDEPTTNLDDLRRSQLAERLADIQSLRQLFVISHDDTFEQESYHVIQVQKRDGISQVETL